MKTKNNKLFKSGFSSPIFQIRALLATLLSGEAIKGDWRQGIVRIPLPVALQMPFGWQSISCNRPLAPEIPVLGVEISKTGSSCQRGFTDVILAEKLNAISMPQSIELDTLLVDGVLPTVPVESGSLTHSC